MNITKFRKYWFAFSGLLVLSSFVLIGVFGLNFGLDFTGGVRWDIRFEDDVEIGNVRDFFYGEESLSMGAQVQASENGEYFVTIEDLSDDQIQVITKKLEEQFGVFETKNYRKVDATIGQSFKRKSFYAILFALFGIVIFVAFAFRRVPAAISPWRFGAVAIIALFHDILIVLGVFTVLGYFLGVELDLPFITALLATLGFSVNDTIVILDRVRENIRTQKAYETFEDTVEKSVQQTLFRSVNTSVSTLLPLFALLFFGASSIYFFVLALVLGIFVGTYSSIFLAAPMLVTWKDWVDSR